MNPINPTFQSSNSQSLKRSFAPALALFGFIFGAPAVSHAAAFTPGNVVVYRVGNGTSEILANTGNSIFLDEFSPTGSLVQSIALPNSGSNAVIASGTASSEGLLSRSGDGQLLVVTGYNTAVPYGSSISSSASATVNRAVVLVNTSGAIASTSKFSDWATGNNPRSAVTNDGTQLWLAGGAGGIRYAATSATTATQINTPATLVNFRQLAIFNGQLYATSSSATGSNATSIGTVGTGLPTASAALATLPGIAPVTTISGTSRYAMFFADLSADVAGVDTLYIVDDAVLALSKYSLVSGNWVLNNTIGADADDYRGVTGAVSGSTVTLFATRKGGSSNLGGGELVKIIDAAGYNASISATPTLLASAIVGTATAPNTSFRGVAIAPGNVVALPSVNLSVSASTGTEAGATAITVTATASAAVTGDQTISLAVTGTGITAGDYTLSNATITILNGATTGTVTFTVADDAIVEGTETATLTISSPSAGLTLGSTTAQNVAITDNDVITVDLSVSANAGTESGATAITVTATASAAVTGDQTVSLAVTGTGITAGDYTLSNATITILNGQTTGTVTFTIFDDTVYEGSETATLTISNPTSGITLGTTFAQNVAITDNDPASSGPYTNANRDILAANTTTWSPGGGTLNGTTFVNLGLQGVGRVPANSIDAATGETLGSISDMQISKWRKNGDGSYSGTFNFLPDRGYNSGSIYSNYAARLNNFDFTFTPYTGSAITGLQNQIAMTFAGSERFTYDHDANSGTAAVYTTGLNATGTGTLFGTTVPTASGNSTQSDGTVNNRLTLDSEGLVLDKRTGKVGAGWIGDEYGASVYHFNSAKQIDGQLILPAALIPHKPAGATNFNGTPDNGRRDNQGIEGIAQSPDGTRLFVLLQSATIQDSGTGNQGRSNTRLLVYDISSTDTPTDPIDQYVIQLPRVDTNGDLAVDRTAAQSTIVALNDHQLLILARDGNGRGASGAPVFKSVLLADLSSATDIDGTFDAEAAQVSPGGTLSGSITPLNWTEALNLIGKLDLSVTEVEQFGLNLNAAPGDSNSICEKWEALSLVSANDSAFPNDYFLFVGNDNDFLTTSIKYLDAAGTVQTAAGSVENDSVILAFRVRMTGSFNQTPIVPNSLVDQAAVATTPFSYTFAANSFADPESGTLSYAATRLDDSALPTWLSFNPATRRFSGTPTGVDAGSLLVKVAATDNGSPALTTSTCFAITVSSVLLAPIETWRQSYFNTTANSGLTADDADFDGDGLLNLMEYALGRNPTLTSGNEAQAALPVGVLNDSGDPLLSDRYSLSFSINSPAPTDLTYTVQAGDDLENWTPVAESTGDSTWTWLAGGASHIVVGTPSAGRVTIKVGDMVPQNGTPKRVMRLKVSK